MEEEFGYPIAAFTKAFGKKESLMAAGESFMGRKYIKKKRKNTRSSWKVTTARGVKVNENVAKSLGSSYLKTALTIMGSLRTTGLKAKAGSFQRKAGCSEEESLKTGTLGSENKSFWTVSTGGLESSLKARWKASTIFKNTTKMTKSGRLTDRFGKMEKSSAANT